ncbi:hypothetical protein TNCV_4468841 [Trichonephila clavipes]|nr:hypothetical protein TNCV_4468841 [Trichonephila clavipes]
MNWAMGVKGCSSWMKRPELYCSRIRNTYRCKQLVSVTKGNKSPVRNSINDVHLRSVLDITVNKISPEIGKIVAEKRCHTNLVFEFDTLDVDYFSADYCSKFLSLNICFIFLVLHIFGSGSRVVLVMNSWSASFLESQGFTKGRDVYQALPRREADAR